MSSRIPSDREYDWDVFISYASGDLDSVADPLRKWLSSIGVRVWFDRTELLVGDSLLQRIDEGLARSRYGVVVLSPAFFSRHWTQQELRGLAQRESEGKKVILPVWHEVGPEEVRQFSPMLADRIAARTEPGMDDVALRILQVVRPDILESLTRMAAQVVPLSRVTSGQALLAISAQADAYLPLNDEPNDETEAELIGGFLKDFEDWSEMGDDIGAGVQVRAQLSLSQGIGALEGAGFGVYAVLRRGRITAAGKSARWKVVAVAVLRGCNRTPYLHGDRIMVERECEGA